MFAKSAVFFFALVAFVNAAPIIDYKTNPGVRPINPIPRPYNPIKILPVEPIQAVSSKRAAIDVDFNSSGLDADAHSNALGLDFDLDFDLSLNKRDLTFDFDADIDLHLPGLKRERYATLDIDTFGARIINGLKAHGLDEYVEHFSTRIQRLKDMLSTDVSRGQVRAEAANLLQELRQIVAGRNNGSVQARDIVVNEQALRQLQNFVNNTVNLLRALGKSGAVDTFISQVNNLRNEAQNGTLDAGDLLSAARDIVLSIL